MTRPWRVLVAIPARNEAATIGRCLDSIGVAAAAARVARPRLVLQVVIAADACDDRTADLARERGAAVVETRHGRVGPARAAAIAVGLDLLGDSAATVWVANTDADSAVPPGWLGVHLGAAASGAALLLGSVRIDPGSVDTRVLARWRHRNPPAEDHRYVHGANLGFRADAYLADGGFRDEVVDEDVRLVQRFRTAGRAVVSTDRAPVLTSGRLAGRVPGGFADYLRHAADEVPSDGVPAEELPVEP